MQKVGRENRLLHVRILLPMRQRFSRSSNSCFALLEEFGSLAVWHQTDHVEKSIAHTRTPDHRLIIDLSDLSL